MRCQANWTVGISYWAEFDITYATQKSMKGQAITDHLAENPIKGYQPMADLFPDESILSIELEEKQSNWQTYFHGTVNIHGNGIGAILISPIEAHYPVAAKLRFPYTNNLAEYEACIAGLEAAFMNIKDVEVYGDSILITRKSAGEWGVKSLELAKYNGYLTKIHDAFHSVSCNYLLFQEPIRRCLGNFTSVLKTSEESD